MNRLRETGAAALNCASFVWVVAIRTAYLAFQHRMAVRQLELRAHFQVTLETGLRRFFRIDDRFGSASRFYMQAARAVTRFAAHLLGVSAFWSQTRMGCGPEVTHDFFVAGSAFFGADKFGAWNTGRGDNCLAGRAGKQNHGERSCRPNTKQQLSALTVHPSS